MRRPHRLLRRTGVVPEQLTMRHAYASCAEARLVPTLTGGCMADATRRSGRPGGEIVSALFFAHRENRIDDLLALVHPDVVWQPLTRPGRSVYFGYAGTRTMLGDLRAALGDFRVDFDEIIDLPDERVAARGQVVRATEEGEVAGQPVDIILTCGTCNSQRAMPTRGRRRSTTVGAPTSTSTPLTSSCRSFPGAERDPTEIRQRACGPRALLRGTSRMTPVRIRRRAGGGCGIAGFRRAAPPSRRPERRPSPVARASRRSSLRRSPGRGRRLSWSAGSSRSPACT
jgi:ketosteroid isomerase-like protein